MSVLLLLLVVGLVVAQNEPVKEPTAAEPTAAEPIAAEPTAAEPTPEKTAPSGLDERGFITLGTVRFHPEKKIVEADGYFNLRQGAIEYVACLPRYKDHETLVSLDVNPVDLKTALLLLGVEDNPDPEAAAGVDAIAGDRLMVLVRWETIEPPAEGSDDPPQKKLHESRVEDLLVNGLTDDTMAHCGFVFTGSQFIDVDERHPVVKKMELDKKKDGDKARPKSKVIRTVPVFAPLVTGELITAGHRHLAILNNPLHLLWDDGQYDGYYHAYSDRLPPTPRDAPPSVTMIFRRPEEGEIDEKITHMLHPPIPPGAEPPEEE